MYYKVVFIVINYCKCKCSSKLNSVFYNTNYSIINPKFKISLYKSKNDLILVLCYRNDD